MRNARMDEAQAGIKIAGRNINNLTYTDDTTLMAESEEKPNSLLMKMKEESEKGKKTGVAFHFLLQGIFLTHGSNPRLLCLLHWQVDSLSLSHLESPLSVLRILFI